MTVIAKHDPDVIVDLVGADPAFLERIAIEFGCFVHAWDPRADEIEAVGASVFSVLRSELGNPPPGERHVALSLGSLAEHPLGLPLAFRFGNYDRRPVRLVQSSAARLSIRISSPPTATDLRRAEFEVILELVHYEASKLSDEQLVRLTLIPPLDISGFSARAWGSMPKYWTLPALTTVGLRSQEPYSVPSWASKNLSAIGLFAGDECPETNLSCVVVVGHPSSIPDLCLAWGLRAQRSANRWLPIWVTPEWLRDPSVLEALVAAAGRESPTLVEQWFSQQSTLHLVSATLSPTDLEALVAQSSWSLSHNGTRCCIHDRSRIDRLFTGDFSVGEWAASVGVFTDGKATCASASYRDLGAFSYPEQLISMVSIENYWPPRGLTQLDPDSESLSRFASDGMASFLTVEEHPSGRMVRLHTPSGWEMTRMMAGNAGYEVQPSDKGILGVGIMKLLEDDDGLAVLASSRIHRLLSDMAETGVRQATQAAARRIARGLSTGGVQPAEEQAMQEVSRRISADLENGQFDRQHLTVDAIKKKLGVKRSTCDAVVRWLIERKVLLRGVEIRCSRCGLRRWHPITRLSESHTCDGCEHQSATALPIDQTFWSYRLNELIAHAVDQGVLTHLLTAPRLWDDDPTVVGFLPALGFIPANGSDLKSCEVDLFAIRGGRAVIAECKRSAREFKEDDIDKLVNLGRRLNCSHIIFATTDHNEVSNHLQDVVRTRTELRLEIWDGNVLLDPYASPPPAAEDRPLHYLEWVAAKLEQRAVAQ